MLNTLSIISGKGGSGKTSLAILLSQLFASCGQKVLLIDCDMSTHGATYFFEQMLNQKEKYYTISNILYGDYNVQHNLEILQVSSNIGFIPSCIDFSTNKILREITDDSKLQPFLNEIVNQNYDIVIFDCQAGYSFETEMAINVSKTTLAVIEADAISASALRVLYAQLAEQLDNRKTYQIFNKISKEEQEVYSKLIYGTFFTNITPILFDWNVRKAFVTNELPEINASNAILATSIYELALTLFPQYKDELRKFIQKKKKKMVTLLKKELEIKRLSFSRSLMQKIKETSFPITISSCLISLVCIFYFLYFPGRYSLREDPIVMIFIFSIVLIILLILLFYSRNIRDNDRRNNITKIKREQKQLEEEISQIEFELKCNSMI
jgi:cellulose biosynthesis protein BcsQ/uncharacterized membrane protein